MRRATEAGRGGRRPVKRGSSGLGWGWQGSRMRAAGHILRENLVSENVQPCDYHPDMCLTWLLRLLPGPLLCLLAAWPQQLQDRDHVVLVPDRDPRLWVSLAKMDSSSQSYCLLPSTPIHRSDFWLSLQDSGLGFWKMKYCWMSEGTREHMWPYTWAFLGKTQLPPSSKWKTYVHTKICMFTVPLFG